MKRSIKCIALLLVLALSFTFLPGFAVTAAEPVVLAVLENYGQITRFFYNTEGQVVLRREEYPKWNVDTTYTYHSNGVTASETRTDELGSSVIAYDTHGNPTSEVARDKTGKVTERNTYTNQYDRQNRLIKTVCTDTAGTSRDTIEYTYQGDGSYKVFFETGSISDKFVPYIQKTAWFTKDGILTKEYKEYEFGEHVSIQTEILRNQKGDIIEHRYRENLKPMGMDKFTSKYTYYQHSYNRQGLLLTTTVTYIDYLNENGKETKSTSRNAEEIAYMHDAFGRKIFSAATHIDAPYSETVWEYDNAGNLILERTTYDNWDYTPETQWEYDSENRLLRRKGIVTMSDLDFFLYGTGSQTYEVDEVYTYLPLSQVLAQNLKN